MTDLTKALSELRRVTPPSSPWEAGDFGVGSTPVDYHIATILNAVLSGTMIPRAYAELAVALMVEKAATHVRTAEVPREETGEGAMQRALLNYAADVVSLCAPASALAELQALRDSAAESEGNLAHALHQLGPANAELATLRAQVERLKAAFRVNMLRYGPPGTSHEEIDAAISAVLTEGAAP